MNRTPYPSDLSSPQWRHLEPLLPDAKPGGRPRKVNLQDICNAIFYVLRSGCAWRMLPHDFPPWSTVYHYFRSWKLDGTWEAINARLREQVRVTVDRKEEPSAASIDSQSVKTTDRGGEVGFDGGKLVKGRKRHILVDTMGLVMQVVVTAANVPDRVAAKTLLALATWNFGRLQLIWRTVVTLER